MIRFGRRAADACVVDSGAEPASIGMHDRDGRNGCQRAVEVQPHCNVVQACLCDTVSGLDWLPDRDSNPDEQIQSLSCYHYTIRQWKDLLSEGLSGNGGTGFKSNVPALTPLPNPLP